MNCAICGLVVLFLLPPAWADGPAGDRQLIAQAIEAQATPPGAPSGAAAGPGALDADERAAAAEANLAVAKLELVRGRKALAQRQFVDAARGALQAQVLLRQIPPEINVDELALQADGILARAAREGVNVAQLARDAQQTAPLAPTERDLDREVQGATRIGRQYSGPPRADVDQSGDPRSLRERTVRRQDPQPLGYRPGRELIDVDALLAEDRQRLFYQDALRDAYKADEVRALVEVDEARLTPTEVVSYPPDWPEKTRRRARYAGGVVAQSPSWYDDQGREWYIAVYDIHDLIYVPPDFGLEHQFMADPFAHRNALDRRQLWQRGLPYLGWGGACGDDLIPLLRYFGGVNAWIDRGPKYSLERQEQVVKMIEAFTGTPSDQIISLPPPAR